MSQPEPRSPDEPQSKLASEVAAARRELRSIEASLAGLNTRLTALEQAVNAPPAPAKAAPPQPAPVARLVRAAAPAAIARNRARPANGNRYWAGTGWCALAW